jgi:hypothetical protein
LYAISHLRTSLTDAFIVHVSALGSDSTERTA